MPQTKKKSRPAIKNTQTSTKRTASPHTKKMRHNDLSQAAKTAKKTSWLHKLKGIPNWFVRKVGAARRRRRAATHRSFALTRGRDKPKIPLFEGYVRFTFRVIKIIVKEWRLFIKLLFFYVAAALTIIGLQSAGGGAATQNTSEAANEALKGFGAFGQAALSSALLMFNTFGGNLTEVQGFFVSVLYVMMVLSVIWLLRQRLAGRKVVVRDALYNAGTPIVSMYVLLVIGALQLLPFGILLFVYNIATTSGLLDGGIERAMVDIALGLSGVLTLYFLTTTMFALVMATIPGAYPLVAYRTSKKIILGQRTRLVMRIVWMVVVMVLGWMLVMVPLLAFVKQQQVIALLAQILTGTGFLFGTTYCYLLYRRMIDEPAK